ncbi:MAG: hypothetical protein ACXWJE_13010, partial [Burkholderiaceae bacterium]
SQLLQILSRAGISTVILGCTELSIAQDNRSTESATTELTVIDSSLSLAKVSLRRLGYIS